MIPSEVVRELGRVHDWIRLVSIPSDGNFRPRVFEHGSVLGLPETGKLPTDRRPR